MTTVRNLMRSMELLRGGIRRAATAARMQPDGTSGRAKRTGDSICRTNVIVSAQVGQNRAMGVAQASQTAPIHQTGRAAPHRPG
jgi:hypothetical protein